MEDFTGLATSAVRAIVAYTVLAVGLLASLPFGDWDELVLVVLGMGGFITGLCWLQWFRPLYRTMALRGRTRFGTGIALWGWIIPGLSVFAPRWLAEDVWRAPAEPGTTPPLPRGVAMWSWLWGASVGCSSIGSLYSHGSVETWFAVVSIGLQVAAAPFAVTTIRRLTERVALLPAPEPALV